MSGNEQLKKAVETLRTHLSELDIGIAGARTLSPGMFNIRSGDKISVSLPESSGDLRITLQAELNKRTGLCWSADSRVLDGTTLSDEHKPQRVLDAINAAAASGKLDDLSIAHLEAVADPADRRRHTVMKANYLGGNSLASTLLKKAEGAADVPWATDVASQPRGRRLD